MDYSARDFAGVWQLTGFDLLLVDDDGGGGGGDDGAGECDASHHALLCSSLAGGQ